MSYIRPYRSTDDTALIEICVKTADDGADATGVLSDDRIWAEIFVLPYVARHPEFGFVVVTDDDRVAGYIVAAPDTDAFEAWFRSQWWPQRGAVWTRPHDDRSRQGRLLRYADDRGTGVEPFSAQYPAHLHIDLLPELQGEGWGRMLIDTLVGVLREAGITGVHLVASAENTPAAAFYPRVGFAPIPARDGVRAFGRRL